MNLNKQKTIIKNPFIKNELKHIDYKIIIFIVTLFINLLMYNNEPILIVNPFLVMGYLLGFSYLVIVIMASFIGALLYSPLSFYLCCLFIITFLILIVVSKMVKTKIEIKLLSIAYLGDLVSRLIYGSAIKNDVTFNIIFYSLITLLITYLLLNISKYLLNEEEKQCPYLVALSILVITSLSLVGLDYYISNLSILFIVLCIFFLFTSKILDYSIYCTFLFINLFILLLFSSFNEVTYLLLFIPCLLSKLTNKKYYDILIYYLVSIVLLIVLKVEINYIVVISYLLIGLIYLLIPNLLLEYLKDSINNPLNNLKLYEKKYQRKEKEIELELNKFRDLFSLIVKEYEQDNNLRLERKREDIVYHSLCINCHKNKICYGKDDSLKRLMIKSIESELNDDEVSYINKECFKPSKFLELSNLFRKDFYKEYKYNLEYLGLKDALSSQLKGLENVLSQYVSKLSIDTNLNINYENELIRNLLDQHQYDVLYSSYKEDYKKNITINICVKIKDHQEIYKIRDLLIDEFKMNIEIKEVSNYALNEYLKIEFRSISEYKFSYGVHQINHKEEGNGDSYLVYESNNYMIYSISDGMGTGKAAQNESRFTLKVLKSILDTGMDLKNGISLINSLLKIKNRYETYATLDLVSINKKSLKTHFFKNGSMHSYIFSSLENRLIKISSSSLPIGILDHIYSSDFSYKLRINDYIIMFSDGIKENEDAMEGFFRQVKEYNSQIIAKEIATKFRNLNEIDDVSVIVIKIEGK